VSRQVLIYFSWSRPGATGAPLTIIDDRFPALFELEGSPIRLRRFWSNVVRRQSRKQVASA